jgi:hypothetical protein
MAGVVKDHAEVIVDFSAVADDRDPVCGIQPFPEASDLCLSQLGTREQTCLWFLSSGGLSRGPIRVEQILKGPNRRSRN